MDFNYLLVGNKNPTWRTFDHKPKFDERSRTWPVRMLVAGRKPRSYSWRCQKCLDQGTEGACTGFATTHEAIARPVELLRLTATDALDVYRRAKQIDEWPGEDYEGSSVLAAVKAAKEKGWYGEYRWSFNLDELVLAVGYAGPAILGIPWYEGMCETGKGGYIHAVGKMVGRHAILMRGVSLRRGAALLHNSWGPRWGQNGDCWLAFDYLADLLKDQGEACIPVKRLRPR